MMTKLASTLHSIVRSTCRQSAYGSTGLKESCRLLVNHLVVSFFGYSIILNNR